MNKDKIRDIFLAAGFTIKEGQTDLKPYVYAAAEALEKALMEELQSASLEPTDAELTAIYKKANNEHTKPQPITTQRIFKAMRAMLVRGYQIRSDRAQSLETAIEQVREWIAERPEDRKVSAGSMVAALTRALQANPQATPKVEPLLVRDLAEILDVDVPTVCRLLVEAGYPQRSTNMVISWKEALEVTRRLKEQREFSG